MPRRKRSKLKKILSDIEKLLAEHVEQTIIHPSEAPKKKRVKKTRKTTKKERPIDF
jgi:hypothetical protein|tara:strand:- start:789 stop:956 length:168 start_codon:yes stop_codon:yes gene_type:complete